MRNLSEVIEAIKAEIPNKGDENDLLLHRIDKILDSVNYASPENQGLWWNELAILLNNDLPKPLEKEWQVKVVSIFTTKSEDEVKQIVGYNPKE